MTTLEVAVERAIPGEPITPGTPWIRLVGGEVIRYVRPSIEPATIRDLRDYGNTTLLQRLLERTKEELEDHLVDLPLLYDINVPSAEVTVEDVPCFLMGMTDGWHPGLKITTDFVEGYRADKVPHKTPSYIEATLTSYTGLQRYISSCADDGRLFLSDICVPRQYYFQEGKSRLTLLDLDPFFAEPTEEYRQRALQDARESFQNLLPDYFEANA